MKEQVNKKIKTIKKRDFLGYSFSQNIQKKEEMQLIRLRIIEQEDIL